MIIGRMRHRVEIKTPSTSTDAEGNVSETLTTVRTIWADIQPGGGEYVHKKFGILDDNVSLIMHCRINSAVAELNVVVFNSKLYEIVNVFNYVGEGRAVALLKVR